MKIKIKKSFFLIGIIFIIAIIAITIFYLQNNKLRRVTKAMLVEYPYAVYELSEDRSYLKLDTIPLDEDGLELMNIILLYNEDGEHQYDTYNGIKFVNEKLGFNNAVIERMEHTTKEMEQQRAENKQFVVTWSYQPYDGLEVMYELK